MSNSCLERLLIMGIKLKLYIFYSEKQAVYSLVKHSKTKKHVSQNAIKIPEKKIMIKDNSLIV